MDEFYTRLTDILEVDEVAPSDVLRDFAEWDSLTVLSVIAMLDAHYGINISAADLRQIATAGELADLAAAHEHR
jgi:acyl carrier protein